MEDHTVTVSTKGQLVIPAEIRKALHIKPGMRFAVLRERNQIILRPVNRQFIDELRGITAGRPSATDMLLKERRDEDKRAQW
ncbi:MAG: AbrB/MazE/SpoVT family DNA-binding domain-containing protein [Acidobacteriaceae bacterium]